jgi:predicted RNase H-like HicB family nuclease
MRNYIALIYKETASDYGVSFADFPGLATAGKSLDEARAMAEDALAFHIEGLVEDNEATPEPSSLKEIMSDPITATALPFWFRVELKLRRQSE